ncbi:hypothetical protein FNAPI_4798 [Fusarium napiforme]|uniref:Uncharacterized protein n=1 Tax=Fusarium napiforme TaxID=42672 RepID=A0A8H5JQC1_9HYPO|nr:hypothetical protein FNAPI_4798 [Fusarium napiforme]
MPETVSQNEISTKSEPPAGDQSGSGPEHTNKNCLVEDKRTREAKTIPRKKVRFKEDQPKMDLEDKKPHKGHNHKESAPKSYRFSLWDGEIINEMDNCLIKAKADLKRVQARVKELEDKKKALLREEEDLQAEIAILRGSIKKKRSLALFGDIP